jgi:crossover junction endodeoxyribonuclease RuvC
MRVLGVDPGLRLTGYGCVEVALPRPRLIEAGVLRLARTGCDGEPASVSERLAELDRDFRELLERLRPGAVAIEGLFAHFNHPATAIVMGHARGVLLLAVRQADLPLIEIKPAEVKKSLTGSGRADKAQMQRAVQAEFDLAEPPSPPDVADAMAIALCALNRARVSLGRAGA